MTVGIPTYGSASYSLQVWRKEAPSTYTLLQQATNVFNFQQSIATPVTSPFYFIADPPRGTDPNSYTLMGIRTITAKQITISGITYPAGSTFYRYGGLFHNINN
jgi:hypothetical protein